jgi:hypothetical protein
MDKSVMKCRQNSSEDQSNGSLLSLIGTLLGHFPSSLLPDLSSFYGQTLISWIADWSERTEISQSNRRLLFSFVPLCLQSIPNQEKQWDSLLTNIQIPVFKMTFHNFESLVFLLEECCSKKPNSSLWKHNYLRSLSLDYLKSMSEHFIQDIQPNSNLQSIFSIFSSFISILIRSFSDGKNLFVFRPI